MATGVAVQRGSLVYVYDEKGRQLCALSGGTKPEEGLKGYTGKTVSIQRGGLVYTYDEKGRQLSAISAPRGR